MGNSDYWKNTDHSRGMIFRFKRLCLWGGDFEVSLTLASVSIRGGPTRPDRY